MLPPRRLPRVLRITAPRRALTGLAALVLASGCGSGATSPAEPTREQLAGTYTLRSVAGRALPAAITGTSTMIVVERATRTLRADGTCEDVQRRTTSHGPIEPATTADRTVACTWTVQGRALTFRLAVVPGIYEQATTTATIARDGSLVETSGTPDSPYGYYPRGWAR